MTDRERQFASLGYEYAEGIERCQTVTVPATGREVRRNKRGKWECQPYQDNYWLEFDDLLEALTVATPPKPTSANTPILKVYADGKTVRAATEDERDASIEAAEHDGGAGVIRVDDVNCYVED